MKRLRVAIALGMAMLMMPPASGTAQAGPEKVVLREGTPVPLQFAQKLTSKTAVVGQPVELVLADDVKVGEAVVVRKGARVIGTVVGGKQTEKQQKYGHAKELVMRVDFLRAGDTRIPLRGTQAAEGKRDAGKMVAGTIVFGLAGLLMTSGKKFVIPEGTPLTAFVDEDCELPVLGVPPGSRTP